MRRSKRLLAGRVPCRCAEARAGPRYRILRFVETINARKRHHEASDKPHPHGPYRPHRRRLPRRLLEAARGRASVARPSSGRQCLVPVETAVLDRLRAMRRPGES
jgi:hypothetical protein